MGQYHKAGMLLFDAMAHHEAIEVIGAERFARYEGYAHSFRFAGDFVDTTARDACGKRNSLPSRRVR